MMVASLTESFTQVDEERKVEAVREFYENAGGNERIVERLQFISKPAPIIASVFENYQQENSN